MYSEVTPYTITKQIHHFYFSLLGSPKYVKKRGFLAQNSEIILMGLLSFCFVIHVMKCHIAVTQLLILLTTKDDLKS